MKITSRFILISLLISTLSACQIAGQETIRPKTTTSSQMMETQTKDTVGSELAEGSTAAEESVTIPKTTTREDESKPEPVQTVAEEANPTKTGGVETKPYQDDIIRSNITTEFQEELSKPDTGVIIVYRPDLYQGIKAITKWDIVEFNTGTQLFLITKEKSSRVEVLKSKLTDGVEVLIPGEVIRHWETTSDFEVIRILYTDPETMPFNFIRVIEPNGQKTTLSIQPSMRENLEWESFSYDQD